ncbi:MAG: LysR family transcriptional regulator [Alphaproteobacteria bacterium]|nr:LysR family transcriptional regulator [Alphaproteobacteria bacterium]
MDLLKAMRTLIAVADNGGFSAAARSLGQSPPSVTREVAALEERFGCKLLTRTTRQVRLTEAGTRYLADARRILAEVSEAEAAVAGVHGELRGPITVTAPATFGRLHVARRITDFALRHPQIRFTTLFLDRMVNLVDEGVDVALRIAQLPDSSATAIRVGSVRQVLCAAPAYIDRIGPIEGPEDLQKAEGIYTAAFQGPWPLTRDGRTVSMRPPARFVANTIDGAHEAARAGIGVVRLLSYQVADAIADGSLVPLLRDYEPDPVPVHVVHLEGRNSPMRIRSFIDYLVEELRREPVLRNG